ncbi:MAG TPA: M48 family metalloprotease [Burkholderiaceae bacterium]
MRFRREEQSARRSTWRLLALFVLVLAALVVAVNAVLALVYRATFPFAHGWPAYFFETNTALVLLFVLGGCWVESLRLRDGGAHVALMAGGREARPDEGGEPGLLERRFVNIVQEMAIASGHPAVPAAWVLSRDDAINAFAAGWGEADAVVAVTRGALERLTRAELQGVVAHEFSHLVHGDTRLNMRLVGLVWGLQMVWHLGRALWEPGEDDRRGAGALFGLGLIGVGALGWAAGRLLQAAVSRQREFLADASAVKYTRSVDGLGGALRKIAAQQAQHTAALRSSQAESLAHLLLAHRAARAGWRALWQTHPPLAERLLRLYGHPVLPLADAVQPIADDDPDRVDLVPAMAPGFAPDPGGTPDALRQDPTQVPTHFDVPAREREALARIALWHGPGEWQAAMLALALGSQASAAGWNGWQAATRDLPVAAAVRREIEALGAGARREVFAALLQRACADPASRQRQARRALLQRWRACTGLPPSARWRALVIGLQLGPRPSLAARAAAPAQLGRHGDAAHAATRQLATLLGVPDAIAAAWRVAAARALAECGAPAPPGSASPARDLLLALRVRRIAPMQRPLLLRAWLLAAERCGLADDAGTGDVLHLACLALGVPVPESLLRSAPREAASSAA